MAKIVITIEDTKNEEGTPVVSVNVESDPPFNMKDESANTGAHVAAIMAVTALHTHMDQDGIDSEIEEEGGDEGDE